MYLAVFVIYIYIYLTNIKTQISFLYFLEKEPKVKPATIIILLTFFLFSTAYSQHQNNIWYFGRNAGLNFNTSPPSPIYSNLVSTEGTAAISDPLGNLLFYTDGLTVWDRNHDTMPNGTGLLGGYSSTQSALIVPLPSSFTKYFIFTTQDHLSNGGLSYSIVDMELNNGLGDVVSNTKNTLVLAQTSEKVTCVLHENGHDIWVITHTRSSNEFFAFLVSASGINTTPVISSIGSFYPVDAFYGPIKTSHKGTKIVASNLLQYNVEMFDFNKATGELTNYYNINALLPQFQHIYGIEFSPNDSLLYLSSALGDNTLFQIDIETEEVNALNYSPENTYGALQLGPDNEIYLARNSANFIDIIHRPNQRGLDCEYEDEAIYFPDHILSKDGLPSYCLYSFFLPKTQILGSDTVLCAGQTLDLTIDISKDCAPVSVTWNDGSTELIKTIDQPGTYWVNIESLCGNVTDTIQIDFVPCLPIIYYALDSCSSYMSNGTNMDYSEFVPDYPTELACADVSATNVYRSPPLENKHSCTPGVNESVAMCISSHPSCAYEAGHQASLIIDAQINPHPDSLVMLTGLDFFEKAPAQYDWIDGPSGDNNYPTKYGIRILKNGTEIYRSEDISTGTSWTLQSFDFLNDTAFQVKEPTLFRIELLPYCPIGNGAQVSAWDIDEILIYGGCVPANGLNAEITGKVITKTGYGISHVEMQLAVNPSFTNKITNMTNASGTYSFPQLENGNGYFLQGYKNDDVLNGVSAIDLVLIQKHLLGITPFTSLEQYIAADVNHDERVNVLDLVLLQKLLLGSITELPRNTSWRFGYLPQDMSGQDLNTFKEVYNFESINQGHQFVDFIGIKIGDLNGDAKR